MAVADGQGLGSRGGMRTNSRVTDKANDPSGRRGFAPEPFKCTDDEEDTEWKIMQRLVSLRGKYRERRHFGGGDVTRRVLSDSKGSARCNGEAGDKFA